MKKRSILGRVAVIAMALTLATTSMMSGTLARYAKTQTASAYAVVAKWNPTIKANTGSGGAWAEIVNTIDLAKTLEISNTNVTMTQSAFSAVGANSTSDDNGVRIAPGTKGSVQIQIDTTANDVATLCEVILAKNSNYSFPGHVKLTVSGNGITSVEKTATWKTSGGGYDNPLLPLDQGGTPLLSLSENTALLFPNKKDLSDAQQKVLTLSWDWPLDYKDDVYGTKDGSVDKYNEYDANDGIRAAGGTDKFGFDLVVRLKQLGDESSGFTKVTP